MSDEKPQFKSSVWKEKSYNHDGTLQYEKAGYEAEAPTKEGFDHVIKKTLKEMKKK